MQKPYNLPLLPLSFDSETELAFYKKVVDAQARLEKLKQKLHYSLVNESFIQLLTLQESVQSTRIEGTQVTFSEMLEDKIDQHQDPSHNSDKSSPARSFKYDLRRRSQKEPPLLSI